MSIRTAGDCQAVEPIGLATRLTTLYTVAAQPDIAAICLDATITPCALPDTVRALGVRVHEAAHNASPISFLEPDDHPTVMAAVVRARTHGCAEVSARLADSGDIELIHVVNMIPEWGVIVVLVGGSIRPFEHRSVTSADVPTPRRLVHHRDRTGHQLWVDAGTELLLGWKPSDLIGTSALDIVDPADHDRAIRNWVDMLAGLDTDRLRIRYLTASGTSRWMEATSTNRLGDPDAGHVEVELIDVHDEMLALTAARSRETQFEALTDSLPVGVVQMDAHGSIVYANQWLRDLTNTPEGSPLRRDVVDDDDRAALHQAFDEAIFLEQAIDIDVVIRRGDDNEARNCRFRIRTLGIDDDGKALGAIASIEDITDSLRHQQRLHDQIRHDFLTGLPNRLAVTEWLEQTFSPGPTRAGVTVLYFDLDGFKNVNDRFGHDAGDRLLREVAAAARQTVQPGDLLARVGGDEFVIARNAYTSIHETETLARDVLAIFDTPFAVGGSEVSVGCSIGIARGIDRDEISSALRMADMAMYRAKRAGGHGWNLFQAGAEIDPITQVTLGPNLTVTGSAAP